MGKGNRNRANAAAKPLTAPKKNNKQKKDNGWILPVALIVILAIIAVSIVASLINDSGMIRRGRILLKSQTGKFDVNQQMVTYLAWEEMFSTFQATYGNYISSGQISNTTYSDEYEFALYTAQYFIAENLGSVVKDMKNDLLGCVAVCDYAYSQGIRLDEKDQKSIDYVVDNLKSINNSYYNPYGSLNQFLGTFIGTGVRESDVRDALEMTRMYSKYIEQLEDGYENNILPEELAQYIDSHKPEFYKTDVLQYIADEAFIKELANCKTPEEFREKALGHFFDKNYKTLFNKHTTVQTAKEELASFKGINNTTSGNALDDKLNELRFDPVKPISKTDESYPQSIRDWLFNSKRAKCDSVLLETPEKGVYLISFYSDAAAGVDTQTVDARIKHTPFSDGVSYGDNDNFMAEMRAEFISSAEDKNSDKYETLDERSEKLQEQLKAAIDADKAAGSGDTNVTEFFKPYSPTEFAFQIDDTAKTNLLPDEIFRSIQGDISQNVKGNYKYVGASEDNTLGYLYYFKAADQTAEKYTIIYISVNCDIYYTIFDDIQTSLDEEFAFETTMSYSKPNDDGSYTKVAEWLFLDGRKEGDAAYFVTKKTDTETKEETDVFTAYMVKGTPMYITHEDVVNGGFASFKKEEDAKKALESLKGLTGIALRNDFKILDGAQSMVYDTSLDEGQTDTYHIYLTDWMFSADRKANDCEIVSAGGKYYVCVYFGTMDSADRTAKDGIVNDRIKAEVDKLVAAVDKNGKPIYQINERIIEKFNAFEETGTETVTLAA